MHDRLLSPEALLPQASSSPFSPVALSLALLTWSDLNRLATSSSLIYQSVMKASIV
jgi:hypothetical protein